MLFANNIKSDDGIYRPVAVGDPPGEPPLSRRLHSAVLADRCRLVRAALLCGAAVDAPNSLFQTPLFVAALLGRRGCVHVLLAFGASVNGRCGEAGYTATHAACFTGDVRLLKRLLRHGADLRLCDTSGRLPADWARLQPDPCRRLCVLRLIEELRLAALAGSDGLRSVSRDHRVSSATSSGSAAADVVAGAVSGLRSLVRAVIPTRADYTSPAACMATTGGFGVSLCGCMSLPTADMSELYASADGAVEYPVGAYTVMSPRIYMHSAVCLRYVRTSTSTGDDSALPPPADLLIDEAEVLRRLRHPSLLLLMAVVATDNGNSVALVFEAVRMGSLYVCLHRRKLSFTAKQLSQIILQVCSALRYMHSSGWLHCAVTSHAVHLLSPCRAKLSGLEYAAPLPTRIVRSSQPPRQRHARLLACDVSNCLYGWLAPEFMTASAALVDVSADVYSLCVVLWEMVHITVPWCDLSAAHITRLLVLERQQLQVLPEMCPPYVRELLTVGLRVSAEERDLQLHEVHFMMRALACSRHCCHTLGHDWSLCVNDDEDSDGDVRHSLSRSVVPGTSAEMQSLSSDESLNGSAPTSAGSDHATSRLSQLRHARRFSFSATSSVPPLICRVGDSICEQRRPLLRRHSQPMTALGSNGFRDLSCSADASKDVRDIDRRTDTNSSHILQIPRRPCFSSETGRSRSLSRILSDLKQLNTESTALHAQKPPIFSANKNNTFHGCSNVLDSNIHTLANRSLPQDSPPAKDSSNSLRAVSSDILNRSASSAKRSTKRRAPRVPGDLAARNTTDVSSGARSCRLVTVSSADGQHSCSFGSNHECVDRAQIVSASCSVDAATNVHLHRTSGSLRVTNGRRSDALCTGRVSLKQDIVSNAISSIAYSSENSVFMTAVLPTVTSSPTVKSHSTVVAQSCSPSSHVCDVQLHSDGKCEHCDYHSATTVRPDSSSSDCRRSTFRHVLSRQDKVLGTSFADKLAYFRSVSEKSVNPTAASPNECVRQCSTSPPPLIDARTLDVDTGNIVAMISADNMVTSTPRPSVAAASFSGSSECCTKRLAVSEVDDEQEFVTCVDYKSPVGSSSEHCCGKGAGVSSGSCDLNLTSRESDVQESCGALGSFSATDLKNADNDTGRNCGDGSVPIQSSQGRDFKGTSPPGKRLSACSNELGDKPLWRTALSSCCLQEDDTSAARVISCHLKSMGKTGVRFQCHNCAGQCAARSVFNDRDNSEKHHSLSERANCEDTLAGEIKSGKEDRMTTQEALQHQRSATEDLRLCDTTMTKSMPLKNECDCGPVFYSDDDDLRQFRSAPNLQLQADTVVDDDQWSYLAAAGVDGDDVTQQTSAMAPVCLDDGAMNSPLSMELADNDRSSANTSSHGPAVNEALNDSVELVCASGSLEQLSNGVYRCSVQCDRGQTATVHTVARNAGGIRVTSICRDSNGAMVSSDHHSLVDASSVETKIIARRQ